MRFFDSNVLAVCDCGNSCICENLFFCSPCNALLCKKCLIFKVTSYSCSCCSKYCSLNDAIDCSFRCQTCKICPVCFQNLELHRFSQNQQCIFACGNCHWEEMFTLDFVKSQEEAVSSSVNELLISQALNLNNNFEKIKNENDKMKSIKIEKIAHIKNQNNIKKITEKLDPIYVSKAQDKDYYITKPIMKNKINNVVENPNEKSFESNSTFSNDILNILNFRHQRVAFQDIIFMASELTDSKTSKILKNVTLCSVPNDIYTHESVTLRPIPLLLHSRPSYICSICKQNVLFIPSLNSATLNEKNTHLALFSFPYISAIDLLTATKISIVITNDTFETFDLFLKNEKNEGITILELDDSTIKIQPTGRYTSDLRLTLILRNAFQFDPFVQVILSFHSRKVTKDIGFKLYLGNLNP